MRRYIWVVVVGSLAYASLSASAVSAEVACGPGQVEAEGENRCVSPEEAEEIGEYNEANARLPLTALHVKLVNHHGTSYAHPGYTALEPIATPEAAYITDTALTYHNTLKWLTEDRESNVVNQPWTCERPHQQFGDRFTARANVGATLTATVHYHADLSARWCAHALAALEAAAVRAKRQYEAELKRSEENERASAEAERHRIEAAQRHFESNCRAIGGSPVEIDGGTKIVCRAPNGGTLIVPQ